MRKRENFRDSFDGFDFEKIIAYDESKIQELLQNKGIVRHRGKIEAVINNAQRAIELQKEKGSLSDYFWSFKPDEKNRPAILNYEALTSMGVTEESKALSKDLKKRGWKFVGPTTCYAFMQAMGLVNDHLEGCSFR